jgi:hypothetical protein
MKQLTYAEIELLQYILNKHMFDSCRVHSKENISLQSKLITMRAELEYPHNNIKLSSEEIVNSL